MSAAMKKKLAEKKNILATILTIFLILGLYLTAYVQAAASIRDRCIARMEEGVNVVVDEIAQKFARDSRILNATADILGTADEITDESVRELMSTVAPLAETMQFFVLMPDDSIVSTTGISESDSDLSFAREAPLGEHISDRMHSIGSDSYVLRHFVPIQRDGETVALLYGVTDLRTLPNRLNIRNIYNASASVYIIDTRNGDFILDTYHDELGNINQYTIEADPSRETKEGVSWEEYTDDILNMGTGLVVFRTDSTDGWEYMYYGPAGLNGWSIIVSVPEKEAFVSLYAVQRIFLFTGTLMVIVLVLYYFWSRHAAQAHTRGVVEKAVLEEKLQKAEAAERAKTMFLSNMSHDIRTPMNAIIGFTTLAETNIDNKDRVQDYLSKIMSSSNHLLSLINDILDMSRIESGRLNIEEKPCSISDIFKDMRNILLTQMQSKQLNFFMDTIGVIDEDIYCDKLHLNQVLLNLLSNAIKFTPAGGSVALSIEQKPSAPKGYGAYEIRVKDTGIGMSPEFAAHVFEPFEREKTSTVSGIQGTGLGMAITKNIVDTMRGTIRVETEQGRGTEYIVDLEFRLQTETKPVETIRELAGLRSLVVDDNFSTCDSVSKMLIQIGMRAEWTLRGQEAVLHAQHAAELGDPFYAYIIDWALPDLNGIEVARQIRAIAGENVPIIVLTAYDWSLIEDDARKAGVTAFCNKPIFLSELRDTLVSALDRTAPPEAAASVLPPTGEELKGKRLLLVEDNELNREIAQELLEESGLLVETAEDGTVGVEKVKASQPGYYDLILMDVQMPVMNGYDATRAIRALEDPALANIPILAMTANAFEEDRQAAIDAGMNGHLAKPINIAKLIETLRELLSK